MTDNSSPSSEPPSSPGSSARPSGRGQKQFFGIVAWVVGVFVVVLITWLNLPRLLYIPQTSETPALPAAIDPTTEATRTPRPSPSPAPTSAPTATAFPASTYYLENGSKLRPPIPGVQSGVIVLDEATSATADPPFDSQYWSSSDDISKDLGFLFDEPYYATFGSGAVTWKTDVPLAPGLYQLFVMDTLYSSAGPLDFQVTLAGAPVQPVNGSTHVEFYSSTGIPAQDSDMWRSLGIFNLDHAGPLSISTQWPSHDQDSPVAIDRVVIVPLSDSTRLLLSALPMDRQLLIMDDLAARIDTSQLLYPEAGALAWGDQFQYLVNPDSDVRVRWTVPDYVLPGQYQVAVWLPETHANSKVTFHLSVNDTEIPDSAVEFDQSSQPGGRWVSIGVWDTPRIYEKPLLLTLEMDIPGGVPGETAIDAVALIKTP